MTSTTDNAEIDPNELMYVGRTMASVANLMFDGPNKSVNVAVRLRKLAIGHADSVESIEIVRSVAWTWPRLVKVPGIIIVWSEFCPVRQFGWVVHAVRQLTDGYCAASAEHVRHVM